MDARSLLAAHAELGTLSADQRDALAFAFVEQHRPGGDELIALGSRTSGAYLIVDGQVVVTVEEPGVSTILARLGPGELIGQVSLFDGAPASASCRAVGDARVAFLGAAAFSMLTRSCSAISHAFQRLVAAQVARDYRNLAATWARLSHSPVVSWQR